MASPGSKSAPDMAVVGFINALYLSILNCNPKGRVGSALGTIALPERSIEEQIYNLHVEILARDTILDRFGKRFSLLSREEHRHRRRLKKYCGYLSTHIGLVDEVLAGLLPVVQEKRELFDALMAGFSPPNLAKQTAGTATVFGHYGCCYYCYDARLKAASRLSSSLPDHPAAAVIGKRSCLQASFVKIWSHMHKLRLTVCITKEIKLSLTNKLQQALGLLAHHGSVHSSAQPPSPATAAAAAAASAGGLYFARPDMDEAAHAEGEGGGGTPRRSSHSEGVLADQTAPGSSSDPTATARSPGLDFDRRGATSPMPDDSLPYEEYTFVPSQEPGKISVLEFCQIPAMVLRSNHNVLYYSKKLRVVQKYGNGAGASRSASRANSRTGSVAGESPPPGRPSAKDIAVADVCSLLLAGLPRYSALCKRKLHSLTDSPLSAGAGGVTESESVPPNERWNRFIADYLEWKNCKYSLEKQFTSLLMELFKLTTADELDPGEILAGVDSKGAGGEGAKVADGATTLSTVERLIVNWQRMVRIGSPAPVIVREKVRLSQERRHSPPPPQIQRAAGLEADTVPAAPALDASDSSNEDGDVPGIGGSAASAAVEEEVGEAVEDGDLDLMSPPNGAWLYSSPRSVLVFAKHMGRLVYEAVSPRGRSPANVGETELKSGCDALVKTMLVRNICGKVLQYPTNSTALQQRDSRLLKQHTKALSLCAVPRPAAVANRSCSSSYSQSAYSLGSVDARTPTPRVGLAAWGQGGDEHGTVEYADKQTLALLSVVGVSKKWIAEAQKQCRSYSGICASPELESPSLAQARLTTFAPAHVSDEGTVALHDFLVAAVFKRSVRMLSLLQSTVMPQEMLSVLICAVKWMMIDASALCADYRLEEEGLDETLPFIILLVLLATTNSVHNLNLLLHLMRQYECPVGEPNSSEEQYYLTCFEAAVAFIILKLDLDALLTVDLTYDGANDTPCELAALRYEDDKALGFLREWIQEQLNHDDVNALITNLYVQGYL